MKRVVVDTSALLAVIDADDANHVAAAECWRSLLSEGNELRCNNYVLVETLALAQHRLGIDAARVVHEDIVPVLEIDWIDAAQHDAAVSAVLVAQRRRLSLVDCVTFETGRRHGIRHAFTLDAHFVEQGFECLPSRQSIPPR